jgi:hypothetical protein
MFPEGFLSTTKIPVMIQVFSRERGSIFIDNPFPLSYFYSHTRRRKMIFYVLLRRSKFLDDENE